MRKKPGAAYRKYRDQIDEFEYGPHRDRRRSRSGSMSGVGRGRTDDPYDRILRAARELFATYGYEGTTVRDVADAAQVNLGAIRYYYASKSGLYLQVLQHVIGPLAKSIRFESTRRTPPLKQIDGVVRAIFDHIHEHPDMPSLMVREMAGGGEISPPIISTMKGAVGLLVAMITTGQQQGAIRAGDPVLLALSTIAQPVYLSLIRRAMPQVVGLDQDDPAVRARIVDHALATVRAALEHRPA